MSSINETSIRIPLSGNDSAEPAIQTGSTSESDFKIGALDPTWVLEGNPVVRALGLTDSQDGLFSSGLWDCTAGKFKFIFACDEIVHIIEGEVTVQEEGAEYTLRPGDVAFFAQGLTTYWTVPHYVKKFCIHRSVKHSPLDKISSLIKRLLKR